MGVYKIKNIKTVFYNLIFTQYFPSHSFIPLYLQYI